MPKDDQVKGYEVAPDDYVVLEPDDEVAAAVPEADKTLAVEAFIPAATWTTSISTGPIISLPPAASPRSLPP